LASDPLDRRYGVDVLEEAVGREALGGVVERQFSS
jgi:hypothetical protein